jgi:hypothetical protein
VSGDLDALDRGVIEAGLTAAEALARVASLEARVDTLSRALLAALAAAGLGEPEGLASGRHLTVVRP